METMAEPLIHCIYASAATKSFSAAEMTELLMYARTNNACLGVSGMLLYVDGSFFQVIEGRADKVDGLYKKIAADKRHSGISLIIREPISERSFADWTMGYSAMNREDIKEIDGLNDFFGKGSCFAELDSGRAKKILESFAKGRWRIRLRGAAESKAVA